MIYLRDNPLLREPLKPEHVKQRLLGHWGAEPGPELRLHPPQPPDQQVRPRRDLPGRPRATARRACSAPVYLEGTYSEIYPNKSEDEEGMRRVLQGVLLPRRHRQPLHAGDARLHPRGRRAGLQRSRTPSAPPSTIRTCSSRWWSATAKPKPGRWPPPGTPTSSSTRSATARCCRSCISTATRSTTRRCWRASRHEELESLFSGYGWTPHFVEGDDPDVDAPGRWPRRWRTACWRSARIQQEARSSGKAARPRWPMIVLRSPKGWTGPKEVDGHKVEGFWRSHQVPLAGVHDEPGPPEAARRLAAQLQARGAVRRRRAARSRS